MERDTSYLFFKNGKAKKKYCMCLSQAYQREIARCNGGYSHGITCAGLRCPYYAIGCGRANIEQYEEKQAQQKGEAL